MRSFIVKLFGGFTDAESAIDAATTGERERLLTLAVKRLFNTISADDILKEVGNNWLYRGRILQEGEKDLLIAEATQLLNSKLWLILQNDVKYQANRMLYLESRDNTDLVAGKLWTYTLDAIETRLKSMKQGKALYNYKKPTGR